MSNKNKVKGVIAQELPIDEDFVNEVEPEQPQTTPDVEPAVIQEVEPEQSQGAIEAEHKSLKAVKADTRDIVANSYKAIQNMLQKQKAKETVKQKSIYNAMNGIKIVTH